MYQTFQSLVRSEDIMHQLQSQIRDPREKRSDIDIFMHTIYYTIDDFLQYEEETFILYLYIGILKRHPDKKGMYQWVEMIKNSKKTKLEVLKIIRYSEEGESQNVHIIGLLSPKQSAIIRIQPYLAHIKSIA